MKRTFYIIISVLILSLGVNAQCDNFPYFMQEIINSANDAELNSNEALRFARNASQSENIEEVQNYLKKSMDFAKSAKDNIDDVNLAILNARANAETCNCLNGQIFIGKIEYSNSDAETYADQAYKFAKKAYNADNLETAKTFAIESMKYSQKAAEAIISANSEAQLGLYSCN